MTRFDWSCAFWANIRGLLNKCELKQASSDDQMGDQIAPGDQMGDLIFTFWSRRKSGHQSGHLERLVVDLVVVDAVTFRNSTSGVFRTFL